MLIWMKDGHEFHKNKNLSNCLFCSGIIAPERMGRLTSALENKINDFISKLERTLNRLDNITDNINSLLDKIPRDDDVIALCRGDFKEQRSNLISLIKTSRAYLGNLRSVVILKQKQPASPVDLGGLPSRQIVLENSITLGGAIKSINYIIADHNKECDEFDARKKKAEIDIRKHYIHGCKSDFFARQGAVNDRESKLQQSNQALVDLKIELDKLKRKIREHGPAADAINSLIASYLGHKELTISPVEQGYELHRHGKVIRGLPSEGEKTAIAVAYFLCSIEAEGRKIKDLIVVVDDPISSLDTKALNFACSLVRSRLDSAGQLFVLTHNLQCMNEFKKGWKSRARRPEENNGQIPVAAFYFVDVKIIDSNKHRSASLVEMSRLLREYDSEYHFLFYHVLRFSENPDQNYEYGYMMPNVLRRVLDIFLAFKCPGSSGLVGQIASICSDYEKLDKDRLAAIERLVQVESHSDNLDDLLSFSNMTFEETKRATEVLLDMIKIVDEQHLKRMTRLCRA